MKKILIGIIVLTVFSITIILWWSNSSPRLNKFMGEWKRMDKAEDKLAINNLVIKKEADAIFIFTGKYMAAAIYRENQNILKTNLFSAASVITYIEETDHILINQGRDGEYIRIK